MLWIVTFISACPQVFSSGGTCTLLPSLLVMGHCNRAAVSRNRYGVEKNVDTHKILINAITFYVCLQEIW
jgi:hypothetical protein